MLAEALADSVHSPGSGTPWEARSPRPRPYLDFAKWKMEVLPTKILPLGALRLTAMSANTVDRIFVILHKVLLKIAPTWIRIFC